MTTPLTVLDLLVLAGLAAMVWFRGWESLLWLLVGVVVGTVLAVTAPRRGRPASDSPSTGPP